MPRAKMLAAHASLAGGALAMTVLCLFSLPSKADPPRSIRVAVGEVQGASAGDEAFTDALHQALSQTPDVRVVAPRRAQLVLRGSVVELEPRRVDGELEVRCAVSLVVADARGGSIRAMLNGRAGARGGGDEEQLSQNALRAAVRGALRPLATSGPALARAR